MSFELHLEEQMAFAAAAVLDGWSMRHPSSEGEREALKACGFSRVPVLTAGSNATTPKSAGCFGVTVTDPEPIAEDDTLWVAEVEFLVKTSARDDIGEDGDPVDVGRIHRDRGRCVQKMLSPAGAKDELRDLANGVDARCADSGVDFRVKVSGWEFVRYMHSVVDGGRSISVVYDVSYGWAG